MHSAAKHRCSVYFIQEDLNNNMRDNAVGKGEMNKPCECLLNIDNTLTPSYITKISRIACPRAVDTTVKPNR